jgi:hypothetical protein
MKKVILILTLLALFVSPLMVSQAEAAPAKRTSKHAKLEKSQKHQKKQQKKHAAKRLAKKHGRKVTA